MLDCIDMAIDLHEKSEVIDVTLLLMIMHSLFTEQEQRDYLKQFLPESIIDELYNYLGSNLLTLNRQYLELAYYVKDAYKNGCNDEELKKYIVDMENLLPPHLQTELVAAFEEIEMHDLDNWLFTSPFTIEEEQWLTQQLERIRLQEEMDHEAAITATTNTHQTK